MIHDELLRNIKENLPKLTDLLDKSTGHWYYEDLIYRFYHHSFKVFHIQDSTIEIVDSLKQLAPVGELDGTFLKIIKEGTGKTFKTKYNDNWLKHTRPLVEAFFHAKYFLEMAVKYGKELEEAPTTMPSGWASLTSLYGIRYST